MKKVSTAVRQQGRFLSQPTRTIGLDLGDRNTWYCVLHEAGQIQLEQRVRTNAQALREVFVAMPRSRVALRTATHSTRRATSRSRSTGPPYRAPGSHPFKGAISQDLLLAAHDKL